MMQARMAASELLALKDLLTMNEDGLDRNVGGRLLPVDASALRRRFQDSLALGRPAA